MHFRPKSKYFAICKDDSFDPETHILSDTPAKAEKACSYDLDDTDAAWLQILNGERAAMGMLTTKFGVKIHLILHCFHTL